MACSDQRNDQTWVTCFVKAILLGRIIEKLWVTRVTRVWSVHKVFNIQLGTMHLIMETCQTSTS